MGRPVSARQPGWEKRLHLLVDGARTRTFEWGVHDCTTFAVETFNTMTFANFKPAQSWSNEIEASRWLKKHPLAYYVDDWFGASVDGWKTARRGDVLLVPTGRAGVWSLALAVCCGPTLACPLEKGLAFVPLSQGKQTWRIG